MAEEKDVLATDPSWYWVQIRSDEEASTYRERGYIVITRAGGYFRTSVPIIGGMPEGGDPHADKRNNHG